MALSPWFFRRRPKPSPRTNKPRTPRTHLTVELLESRVVPSLLGLATEALRPDIASGSRTNFSYTQEGDGTNPFHYDARALSLTLGDGTRYTIRNPSGGGLAQTDLNLQLSNSGAFADGVAGPDMRIRGMVTIGSTTFDGDLLTGEVREFGYAGTNTNTEFEVRVAVSGGKLAEVPNNYFIAGQEVVMLIHQPSFPISKLPSQSFTFTSTAGASDTEKVRKKLTTDRTREPGDGNFPPPPPGPVTQPPRPARCSCDLNDTGDEPLLLHDGGVEYAVVDLEVPGRGLNWQLKRTYRSDVQWSGPLGNDWEMNYSRHLFEVNANNRPEMLMSFLTAQVGDVIADDGGNRQDLYKKSGSTYIDPRGYYTQLTHNGDGSYTERNHDGTVVQYGSPSVNGMSPMTSMSDRDGNTLRYQYDSLGRLTQVIDTLGRPMQYFYDTQSRLMEVRDYSGRSVRYAYDALGNLVAATTPAVTGTPTGNDFPNGKTERYTYSSGFTDERRNHNLLTVIAPNEVADGSLTPRIMYTYDANDRVSSQMLGGTNASGVSAGGTMTYQYQVLATPPPNDFTTPSFQATVTDRNGNITQYQYNQLNNVVQVTEQTNRNIRAGEPDYTTRFSYDGDYRLLQETLPEGNRIQFTYDTINPDRYQQGNLLTVTQLPDAARGGDQTSLTTSFTYEPVYNQVRTMTEPRGNDPGYVPQNGGSTSAARYTTTYTYDYQEGTNFAGLGAILGISAAAAAARLAAAGVPMGLGDVNGDGMTNALQGDVVRTQQPTVQLLPGSNEASVEGTTMQPIVTTYSYNQFGQLTRTVDPERNVNTYDYFTERDPNGDGTIDNPAGDPTTGGYLQRQTYDTLSDPLRDSSTNPAPTNPRAEYRYDAVGNRTRQVDGRGIATDYTYNQLNQVVQITRAAANNVFAPDPAEPMPLVDFQYLERFYYDANGNAVLSQIEDRGNTSVVDGNVPAADLPSYAPNPDPAGGKAFVDTVYKYDILDNRIEILQEVSNAPSAEFLRTRYRYDSNENLVLMIQPAGNATSAVYDERDLPFQTTRGTLVAPPLVHLAGSDPTNYDVRGGLPSQSTFHYDGNRNVIETVDAADTDGSTANNSDRGGPGDRTRYVYDGFDRHTSTIDSVGNQTVYQYDPAGNLVRTTQFGPVGGASPTSDGPDTLPGPVTQNGVIQSGNLVNSNALAATEYLYDELSRPIQTDQVLFINTIPTVRTPDVADGATDLGEGNLTPGDNGAIPGVVGITVVGRVSTRTEYDRDSRRTFTVQDDTDTTRYFYDGASRVIRRVDAEGNTVEAAYDDNSNVIETRETDVSQVAGVANEVFLTTVFYDSLDRVQRATDNVGQTRDYRYDSRNNLVAVADADGPLTGTMISRRVFSGGALTVNAINDFGNVTVYFYDGLGRQTRQDVILTVSGQGDGVNIGASLEGVKTNTPMPDPAQGGGDGDIRTGTTYDANSLPSAALDDQGNVTVYLYDNLNRRVTETKGLTVNTTPLNKAKILGPRDVVTPTPATVNNPAVIPAAQIDTQLAAAKLRINAVAFLFASLADRVDDNPPTTIVYGYDPDDNLLIREDENDTETFARYDALDRRIATRVFRNGQADSFLGDPNFAPAPVSDPSNPSTVIPATAGTTRLDYQYDGLSRLVRATDNNAPGTPTDDALTTYAYDSLNRVIEETQQHGALSAQAVDTAWRAENLRSALIYPNGRTEVYTYDGLDRLRTVADLGAVQVIAAYDYIGVGRLLQRSYPQNGTRETYLDNAGTADVGYDGARRPVQLRHLRSDNSLIVGFMYTYDRMDNKRSETKLHDTANNEVYTYDSAYRLVSFVRPNAGSVTPLQGTWTLDGAGNWKQVDGETRQHSSFNEITRRSTGGGTTILSDDNGNETDDGTLLYTWDFQNRLRAVTRKADGMLVATYSYDAMGRRIRKEVTNSGPLNGTTDFYLDGWQEIEEHNGLNVLTQQYVYGVYLDEPLVLDRNLNGDGTATGGGDQRLFYLQNTLYSVFALTDSTGVVAEGYLYDAYGRQTVYGPGVNGVVDFGGDDTVTAGGTSLVDNAYLFTGRRFDAETKLYYYRARYMDPVQGRFFSRDPVQATNLYEFAAGNPLSFVDPYGTIVQQLIGQLLLRGGMLLLGLSDVPATPVPGATLESRRMSGDPRGKTAQVSHEVWRLPDCTYICVVRDPNRPRGQEVTITGPFVRNDCTGFVPEVRKQCKELDAEIARKVEQGRELIRRAGGLPGGLPFRPAPGSELEALENEIRTLMLRKIALGCHLLPLEPEPPTMRAAPPNRSR